MPKIIEYLILIGDIWVLHPRYMGWERPYKGVQAFENWGLRSRGRLHFNFTEVMVLRNDNTINILQKALDASWIRNKVIANNIANADTPNYKAYRVEFEEHLKRAIDANRLPGTPSHPRHLPMDAQSLDRVAPRIVRDENISIRLDGNNVNIDVETARLAENTILYQALVDQLSSKVARLRTVINEGRR